MAAACWLIGVLGISAAATSGLLAQFGRPEQAKLSAMTAGICTAAAMLSLLPAGLMFRVSVAAGSMGFLVGTLLRLGLCGAAVLIVPAYLEAGQRGPFSLWIAGWYLLALAMDVILIGRHLTRLAARTRSAAKAGPLETKAC
ncbi:MAG: hypothetical protein IT442_11270 [Phycisphaeraceae bacterium]|nr:hypothetical protein [Phycisphaeraceae bacterium]